jgi:hypothetical protein
VTQQEQIVTNCAYAASAALNKRFVDGGAPDAHDGAGGGVFDDSQEVVEGVQGEKVHAKAVTTGQRSRSETHCAFSSSTPRLGRLRLGVNTLPMTTTWWEEWAGAADSTSSAQQVVQNNALQSPCARAAARACSSAAASRGSRGVRFNAGALCMRAAWSPSLAYSGQSLRFLVALQAKNSSGLLAL